MLDTGCPLLGRMSNSVAQGLGLTPNFRQSRPQCPSTLDRFEQPLVEESQSIVSRLKSLSGNGFLTISSQVRSCL